MKNLLDRLGKAKIKLEGAEKEKIVLDTQIKGLQEELEKLGYSDVSAANYAITQMEEEISDLEDTLGEMLNDFESNYASLLENES